MSFILGCLLNVGSVERVRASTLRDRTSPGANEQIVVARAKTLYEVQRLSDPRDPTNLWHFCFGLYQHKDGDQQLVSFSLKKAVWGLPPPAYFPTPLL